MYMYTYMYKVNFFYHLASLRKKKYHQFVDFVATVHMSSAAWGLRLLLLLSPLVSSAVFSSSPRRRWHRPRHRRQHSPFGNTQALVAV